MLYMQPIYNKKLQFLASWLIFFFLQRRSATPLWELETLVRGLVNQREK